MKISFQISLLLIISLSINIVKTICQALLVVKELCVVCRVCLPFCHPILGYWTGQKWQEIMVMTLRRLVAISILAMRSGFEVEKICNNYLYAKHQLHMCIRKV